MCVFLYTKMLKALNVKDRAYSFVKKEPNLTIQQFLQSFGLLGKSTRSKIFLIILTSFLIKSFVCLFIEDKNALFWLGDGTLLLKKRKAFQTSLIIVIFFIIELLLAFNRATPKQMQWLELFDILQNRNRLGNILDNQAVFQSVAKRMLILRKLAFLNVYAITVSMCLFLVELIIVSPSLVLVFVNTAFLFYHMAAFYLLSGIATAVIICIEILGFYMFKRVRNLNRTLSGKFKLWFQIREITAVLKEHVYVSKCVASYNCFWKRLYLVGFACGIPMSLIWLNLVLFVDIRLVMKFILTFALLITLGGLFYLQYNLARMSLYYHKTYKQLCQLQWTVKANSSTKLGLKIKVKK